MFTFPMTMMAAPESEPDSEIIKLNFEGVDGATTYNNEGGAGEAMTFGTGMDISSDQAKFGSTSLHTTTRLQYLVYPDTVAFGTQDFTIETWFYATSNPVNARVWFFSNRGAGGGLEFFCGRWAGEWRVYINNNSVFSIFESNNNIPSINIWNHVALTRNGTTLRIFLNGVQIRSGTIDTNLDLGNGTSTAETVGQFDFGVPPSANSVYYDGYKITLGTALYTGNFTPPTTFD